MPKFIIAKKRLKEFLIESLVNPDVEAVDAVDTVVVVTISLHMSVVQQVVLTQFPTYVPPDREQPPLHVKPAEQVV